MITGKQVLVTGATGFIGGRLVEKLILDHGVKVRALVRAFGHASRISRFELEMIGGSITDPEAVERAVAGCDTVFHCAHDFQDANVQQNLDGTRTLAEACHRHGVRRLVYVSSISVYEPLPNGEVDESTPAEPCGWAYPDNKLAAEKMLLQYGAEHNLEVAVVQPTIVYGPFAKSWTVAPVRRLRSGRLVLPDSGGLCNPVYVDDVVDALILAAHRDEAIGERFLISGPAPVSWREFYAAYERMIGVQSVLVMPTKEVEQLVQQTAQGRASGGSASSFSLLRRDPRRIARRVVNWGPVRSLYSLIGENSSFHKKATKAIPPPLHIPDEARLALLRARASVKIDKARHLLGYEPAFDFERGIKLTAQFVKWANL